MSKMLGSYILLIHLTISEVYGIMLLQFNINLFIIMRRVDYFGNLINEKISPFSLKYFRDNAIPQGKSGIYRLFIINDKYAVGKVLANKVIDYTILDDVVEYKEMYSGSKASEKTIRQALYHGTCILEGYGLKYDL